MPTIFERITGALAENDVSVRVTVQSEALTNAATLVAGLIENPPDEIGDLGAVLRALPLPDLAISGDYGQALGALAAAVPTDLSGLTGDLTGKLEALKGELGGLSGPLGDVLDVVLAIHQATQVDLFCAEGPVSGSGTAQAFVQQLNGILDLFPQPFNVEALLDWLRLKLEAQLPILNDLRDPLATLVEWRNTMNAEELLGKMIGTLGLLESTIAGSVDEVLTPVETALAAVKDQLPTAALAQIADDLALHLGTLRTAVLGGDLGATAPAVAALNTALDNYATIRQGVQSNLALHFAALGDRLKTLDRDLDDQTGRLESLLQPESPLSFIPAPEEAALTVPGLGDLEGWLGTLVEWLGEVADQLDVSAIQEPLQTVVDTLQQAVDGLDAAQITVALHTQSLFAEVEGLLDQIDPAALRSEVEAAIDDFQEALAGQLQELFAPVREAISTAITQIGEGVQSLDPADIVDALKDALDKLADVLEHPEVLAAMNAIRDAIDDTAQALEEVSFTPLTDQVIAEIDKLTAAFEALDTSKLSTPVKLSLQAALAILPSDLTPISDPLLARLGQAVVEGPQPLLETLRQQPKILLDQVRAFEPGKLLGGAISAPYQALLAQMSAFKPSAVLGLAEAELATLKARLEANANPGRLLALLEPPFASLLDAFDQLDPAAVIAPVQTAIQDAAGAVVDALPVEETFAQLDAALEAVQLVTNTGTGIIAALQRVSSLLDSLADPRAQMDSWIDAILTNVNNIADANPLQPALDAVEAALDGTTAAGLTARFDTSAVQSALAALDPQTRLVKIIQAYNGVPRPQLDALPDSPGKAAILAVLDRFNPVDPDFVPPYQKAAELQTALAEAHTRLAALLPVWDARYHETGPLPALRNLEATPENLRTWIGEALEDGIGRPLATMLSAVAPIAKVLGAFMSKLQELVTTLTGKLAALLQGPASLGAIRTKMQELLDKLENFNLDFLAQSIGDLFANLRGKLEAVNPAALRQPIETAFREMLATLKIDLLIPAAQITGLDAAYEEIVDGLKALSPETLVVKVVQPEFEAKIIPLLEVFDPTEALDAFNDRLAKIEEELRAEMARVNEAYQKLRDSIPSISIVDIDIDIEVSVPF